MPTVSLGQHIPGTGAKGHLPGGMSMLWLMCFLTCFCVFVCFVFAETGSHVAQASTNSVANDTLELIFLNLRLQVYITMPRAWCMVGIPRMSGHAFHHIKVAALSLSPTAVLRVSGRSTCLHPSFQRRWIIDVCFSGHRLHVPWDLNSGLQTFAAITSTSN